MPLGRMGQVFTVVPLAEVGARSGTRGQRIKVSSDKELM